MKSEIDRQLFALLGSDALVERWWKSPNRAFSLRTPQDVWEENEQGPDRVRKYVTQFLYGDYF